jgi:hypothetical protein
MAQDVTGKGVAVDVAVPGSREQQHLVAMDGAGLVTGQPQEGRSLAEGLDQQRRRVGVTQGSLPVIALVAQIDTPGSSRITRSTSSIGCRWGKRARMREWSRIARAPIPERRDDPCHGHAVASPAPSGDVEGLPGDDRPERGLDHELVPRPQRGEEAD